MDPLTEEVRPTALWELIFTNDIALGAGTEEELQEKSKSRSETFREVV